VFAGFEKEESLRAAFMTSYVQQAIARAAGSLKLIISLQE